MCELAFNLTGERFEPPASAMFWRVRRLKTGGRGTPDVVFGADGAPLMIPIETELAEFRQLVKNEPGRYRLDPVDDAHRSCEGGCPAYLHIGEGPEPAPAAAGTAQFDIVREVVRANTEMVKSIADRFASVMDSAATLLRAADGAGLPARPPLALAAAEVDQDDDEEDEPQGFDLATLIGQMMPLVQMAFSQQFGGSTKAKVVRQRNASPESAGQGAEEPAIEKPETVAPMGPEAMAHFAAIQGKLTAEERSLAQEVVKELSPAQINAWIEELSKLSVDEAVAKVRQAIGKTGGAA